ncbi:putative peptide zinc metalloprotease protein [Saccharopolyspora kobensis]|uniref:Peptide zinc metalloprotease protein n=1 Tax=Saccharopolyspora kobensis TaxID=146035 RepID=A0A1H6DIY0_9PSEU|nr:hypothetical protein [Saccharopolyspora kobensis]SEG85174.1 putative peptide zinc metalloprotease protein [Saccharopolyspora kobensis]SFD25243.1 putative peptide zinc metalloprotease protein [Saccharopolyspora kobensis]
MSEATEVEAVDSTDENAVPRLVEGVALLGEYEGGGYEEPRYLVSRADGQMVLVSPLLHEVASRLDGDRNLREVAEQLNRDLGTEITPADVAFLVDQKLHPMGIATTTEPLPDPPRSDPLLSLVFNTQLLPPGFVRVAAAIFAPFYRPPVIALMLAMFVGVDVWLVMSGGIDAAFHRSVGDPILMLTLMALWVFATLFHEFGHAAGCHYGGARPGGIGVGILILYPAFYTNVTDAYRLDRRGRLRTDLGGIYFNAIFIVAMFGLYQVTGIPALVVFMVLNHLQILQQLVPLLRLDGYLILGDLVGVPNLFAFVGPVWRRMRGKPDDGTTVHQALRPRVQLLVTTWVLIVVPLLIAGLTLLLIRLPYYLATGTDRALHYGEIALGAGGQGNVGILLLAILSMLILLVPWVGGTAFAIRTGRRLTRVVRKVRARRRATRPHARHRKHSGRWRPPTAA